MTALDEEKYKMKKTDKTRNRMCSIFKIILHETCIQFIFYKNLNFSISVWGSHIHIIIIN